MEGKNESKHTPEKPFGKFPNDPALGEIAQLAYRCIQWEDGEIKGYDMQMFESLLPIMVQPLIASAPALLEENEKLHKENKRLDIALSLKAEVDRLKMVIEKMKSENK